MNLLFSIFHIRRRSLAFFRRVEASHEEPLQGAPAERVAASDPRTAQGGNGGRRRTAQPLQEPQQRRSVRRSGATRPVVKGQLLRPHYGAVPVSFG